MKNKLIVIGGPTAVGKTSISVKLAKMINAEIVSADSMQIYRYMDIGSAKISEEEMDGVVHHMIDIVDPWDNFSAAEYKDRAEKIINDIIERNKVPMLVGGTGLYIDSVICNYNFTEANKDERYREELETLAGEKGNEFVFEMLKEIDPKSAAKLHANNLKRVIRALEVFKLTGRPFSEYQIDEQQKFNIPYDLNYYVLTMNRKTLYERINRRVDIMLDGGLLDEVKKLKDMGCTAEMQSMKGIGYKELLYYLEGSISSQAAVDMIKQGSRNYAKRQLTWFRKDPRITWINRDEFQEENSIIDLILRNFMK